MIALADGVRFAPASSSVHALVHATGCRGPTLDGVNDSSANDGVSDALSRGLRIVAGTPQRLGGPHLSVEIDLLDFVPA